MSLSTGLKSHPAYWRIKLFLKRLSGRELWIRPDIKLPTVTSEDWSFSASHLRSDSVVYSLGVGDSVTFDLQVIEETKATVHAFDPTPFAVIWVNSQALPPQFIFHQWAVSSNDGVLFMTRRTNRRGKKSKVMWSSVSEPTVGEEVIEVPCFSLQSIMQKLNHDCIDLLKMDVEGSEYEILQEIISMPHKPTQLLVEFHHRFPEIGMKKTVECIRDLRAVGYRVLSVSATGREISFIHTSQLHLS